LKRAQRFVALDRNLPGLLDGSTKLTPADDPLEYAAVCRRKGLYAAAARFYAGGLSARSTPPTGELRYKAACAAAMAGCGKGKDVAGLDAAERARLRIQALDWLRADLASLADRLDKVPNGRSLVQPMLQRWRHEKVLACVR